MQTERRHGRVQSLMFFHIPTFEHHHMWFGTQFAPNTDDGHDGYNHAKAVAKHSITGEKHEGVYTGAFNSGIYAAAQERGDVRGIFVGHDHINTYAGNYFGIELGYGPGSGYGTYGLGGTDNHRLRGCRVFDLDEKAEGGVYRGSRNVFARDLGVDTTAGDQKIARPERFPRYVR